MNSEDMPRDVPGAQLKLKQHEQLKVTIAAKENSVKHLWAKGQQLIGKMKYTTIFSRLFMK